MNKYDRIIKWGGIEKGQRRVPGCMGCFPIAAAAVAIIAGLFAWNVRTAAHPKDAVIVRAETVKEVEPTEKEIEDLCGLEEVVCEGEAYASPKQEEWIKKLEICESSGNPKAINPKDRDGTPSYGSFQFKPSTFDMYSKRYGTLGKLMDRKSQYEIVVRMMDDPAVRWQNEFPDCVRKLGTPPKK